MASRTGYGRRAYHAYAPHTLAGWSPTLNADSVNAVTTAERALAATTDGAHTTLGDSLLDWMMVRDESIRSSVMEGVEATVSGLEWARYADQAGRPVSDENDALTLGAAKQVAAAVELGHKIRAGHRATPDDILKMHGCLFEGTRDRAIGGLQRTEPIWIGPPGYLTETPGWPDAATTVHDPTNGAVSPLGTEASIVTARLRRSSRVTKPPDHLPTATLQPASAPTHPSKDGRLRPRLVAASRSGTWGGHESCRYV